MRKCGNAEHHSVMHLSQLRRCPYFWLLLSASSAVVVECLEALCPCFANLDLAAPFGFENLRSGNAATRVGIEDGVNDISAASLQIPVSRSLIKRGRIHIPDARFLSERSHLHPFYLPNIVGRTHLPLF